MPILSILATLGALTVATSPNLLSMHEDRLGRDDAPQAKRFQQPAPDTIKLTILYDNYEHEPGLKTGWGFAALVATKDRNILFDTGADAATLLSNMRSLDLDPASVDAVVLSHAHGDHTGGLDGLLAAGARPTVYLLPSFPADLKRRTAETVAVVESRPGQEIAPGVFTTGEVDGRIPEEALFLQTAQGLVVVTGCAHPGVARMVSVAKSLTGDRVRLMIGGFHLRGKSEPELDAIVSELRSLGVAGVAPCHCSGDDAIQRFKTEYGSSFISAGVGRVILIDS